jgi:hypothetical protein
LSSGGTESTLNDFTGPSVSFANGHQTEISWNSRCPESLKGCKYGGIRAFSISFKFQQVENKETDARNQSIC